jgi:hypothetical protein
MSELKQWADDGASDEVRSLLTAAGAEQPSSSSLSRTLTALAAGAAVGAGSATASGAAVGAKAASLASDVLVRWVMATTVLTTGGAAAVAVFHDSAPRAAPASPATARATSAESSHAPPARVIPSIPRASVDAPASAEIPALAASSAPKGSLVTATDPLAGELSLVDGARGALAAGEPLVALRVLDQYDAQSPRRGFASEALYLRMRALLALGRNDEARAVAGRLSSSHPNSPQAARARQVLAGDDSVIQP